MCMYTSGEVLTDPYGASIAAGRHRRESENVCSSVLSLCVGRCLMCLGVISSPKGVLLNHPTGSH